MRQYILLQVSETDSVDSNANSIFQNVATPTKLTYSKPYHISHEHYLKGDDKNKKRNYEKNRVNFLSTRHDSIVNV